MTFRCEKCGEGVSAGAKFCPACGAKTTEEVRGQKKRKPHPIIAILLGLVGLVAVLYFIGSSSLSHEEQGMYGALALLVYAVLFIAMLVVLVKPWLWIGFLKRHRYVALGLLLGIIAVPVTVMVMTKSASNKEAISMLPMLQDSLSEAVAGKLLGDSGGSLSVVSAAAQRATNQISSLTVPALLADYHRDILDWTIAVTAASKDKKTLQALSDVPASFALSISDSDAQKLFSASMQNVLLLKEFGDRAVAKGDQTTMRYIAAKMLVQEQWMEGIAHSQSAGWLALDLIHPALAAAPDIDSSGPVSCRVTCDAILKGTSPDKPYLWDVYRCNSCVGTLPATTEVVPQAATGKTVSPQDTQSSAGQTYSASVRQVCIGNNIGGVFCVADALRLTHEIAASAIGFAEKGGGKEIWETAWSTLDERWQPIEPSTPTVAGGNAIETGAGVAVGNREVPPDLSPSQKAFYASCEAKGGYIGGANQDKGRLPTTEAGAHCNYKQGANNCWDFMTNSGGRYMGGDVGCVQFGLLPIVLEPIAEPAPAAKPAAPAQAPTKATTSVPAPATPPAQNQTWEGNYVGRMEQSPECQVEEWNDIAYWVKGNLVQGGVGINGAAVINASGVASITEGDAYETTRATFRFTRVNGVPYLRVDETSEYHYDVDDPSAVKVCQYHFYAPRVAE